ncbi:dna repair protein rad16 [Fusarium austroafricanum]|uniref:Dna repair protein rad16 n=1 Tax=Fusarium austroafricanum TaxID=2364996 RepID=A0A8H4JGE4_9HYPO|nr:dna repair protein rad16 [Fusarium austroafricanum]
MHLKFLRMSHAKPGSPSARLRSAQGSDDDDDELIEDNSHDALVARRLQRELNQAPAGTSHPHWPSHNVNTAFVSALLKKKAPDTLPDAPAPAPAPFPAIVILTLTYVW